MKTLSGIIVLVALGMVVLHAQTRMATSSIAACLDSENGGGTDYVPAINGYVSGQGRQTDSNGPKEVYHAVMTYKVISTVPGHFALKVHYIITRDGVSTTVDRTLPVLEKQPDKTKWVKLDNHLVACAYLTDIQVPY
jgi:hypothetical protein